MHDDYYQILGINRNADERQIKSAFRKKAFMFHPDRNQGDKVALEQFKKITEAYGVLIDPVKRKEFDHYLLQSERFKNAGEGFERYGYNDILNDIFGNPGARDVFEQMARGGEVKMDERFIRQILSGGFILGGIFFGFWGISPIGFSRRDGMVNFGDKHPGLSYMFKTLKDRFKTGLINTVNQVKGFWDSVGGKPTLEDKRSPDVNLEITPSEADYGAVKQVTFKSHEGVRRYKIKIPAGIKDGTNLRIKDQDDQVFILRITIQPLD
ncbi:DnaJ domain-containing protein [bacterium]|nr:DnaJ domain-containing protein [bacterium]